MRIDAPGIRPEVVAAIMASICMMLGTADNLAVKIRHNSNTWQIVGRQKLMDSRFNT